MMMLLGNLLWVAVWGAIYAGCVWLSGATYVGGVLTVVVALMVGWLADLFL